MLRWLTVTLLDSGEDKTMTDRSNIKHSVNNILKFENQVFNQLTGWGIEVKRAFRIPGSRWNIDFYIPAPTRFAIELVMGFGKMDHIKKNLDNLKKLFSGQLNFFLIGIGPEWESLVEIQKFSQLGCRVISVSDTSQVNARLAAELIRSHINSDYDFKKRTLSTVLRLNELALKVNYFGDVLISLRDILNTKSFKLLASEFYAFGEEYDHKHWTACALRLGRMNECLIYSIANYADVKIENTEFEFKTSAVAQARNLMDDVQKYLANETSQSVLFEKIDKTCDDYIKSLNKLIKKIKTTFPNKHTEGPGALPTDAKVLEKIYRKYKDLDAVRTQYLFITDKDPNNNISILKKLKDFRNLAAHANAYGHVYEISKSDVDEHRPILRLLLHYLTNIAFAIQAANQKNK